MKPRFLLLFFVLFVFSCKNKNSPPDTPEETTGTATDKRLDFTVAAGERVGLISSENCSPEGILATYGDLAVRDSVYLGEGIWGKGIVIFPQDSRNRVEVFWEKGHSLKYPIFFRMWGDSTGTDWKTKEGITIGTTISEVQKLNGSPFQVFGFGWDYGGLVADWEMGKFNRSMGLRFLPSANSSTKVLGENTFSSDHPDILAARPKVDRLEFRILAKEKLPGCIAEIIRNHHGQGHMRVRKMTVKRSDHYWLNDGAAAYDGTEMVYNEFCEEVCKFGGFRKHLDCMDAYEGKQWELVWEK